jgi:hypothetical protein
MFGEMGDRFSGTEMHIARTTIAATSAALAKMIATSIKRAVVTDVGGGFSANRAFE